MSQTSFDCDSESREIVPAEPAPRPNVSKQRIDELKLRMRSAKELIKQLRESLAPIKNEIAMYQAMKKQEPSS